MRLGVVLLGGKTVSHSTNESKIKFNYNMGLRSIFLLIVTISFISYSLSGYQSENNNDISILLFSFWIIVAFLYSPHSFIREILNIKYRYILIYFSLFGLYSSSYVSITYAIKAIGIDIIVLSPIFMFNYLKKIKNKRVLALTIKGSFIMLVYLSIKLIQYLKINPYITRQLGSSKIIDQGIFIGGGFDLAYALSLLIPVLFYEYLKKNQNKWRRFVLVALIAIFSYILIKSSYAIAVLLCVSSICLILIYRRERGFKTHFYSAGVVIMLLIGYSFRGEIGYIISYEIAPIFEGLFLERRISEFGDLIAGIYNPVSGATSRFNLYLQSLSSFVKYPFIGVGYITQFSYYSEFVGGHSELLDRLARLGLPIYFFYIKYLYNQFKYIHIENIKEKNIINIIALNYFMSLLLNPSNRFSVNFVVFFIAVYFISCDDTESQREILPKSTMHLLK